MRGYVGGFLKEAPNLPQELFPEFSDKKRAKNMCRCTHQGFPQKAERLGKRTIVRHICRIVIKLFHFLLTFSGCRGIIGRNFTISEIRLCISGKEAAHEPHHDPYRIPPGAG